MSKRIVHDSAAVRSPASVQTMFDRIAGRYDLLNRLLSFRRDVAWRRELVRHMPARDQVRVLDVATGTGDVLLAMASQTGRVEAGIGMDVSENMLALARRKLAARGLSGRMAFVRGDATAMPLADRGFDVVSIAFGIRNVADVAAALREMGRVLKPGGRLLVLEFSSPSNRWFRSLYLVYFRHILPRIGGIISGDASAYRYLNTSAETFPCGDAFCRQIAAAGFTEVRATPLTFGIATLYEGSR